MNKNQKEVLQYQLEKEKAIIKQLENQYKRALNDILNKMKILQADIDMLQAAGESDDKTLSMIRSKVYQKQHQEALKKQIEAILDKLHSDEFSTIQGYLNGCYEDGFIGTMYDIAGQGIPFVFPIDQSAAVKAIQLDSKVSKGLYNSLSVDVKALKKAIAAEVTRGIATSLPYSDIARNINNASKAPLNRTRTIARTEGHRIQQQSAEDARQAAKSKGADVVKQWDAALDGKTRDSHRQVDGENRENNERFSNGLRYPGDPNGKAAEVVNCRCVALTRARWALDEDELQTLKDRAEYFGLDKTENFEDFKKKYLETTKNPNYNMLEKVNYSGLVTPEIEANLEKQLSKIPEAHRALAETQIAGIKITDDPKRSGYNLKTKMIHLSVYSDDPAAIIHEYAHALEIALDAYNNSEFRKIMMDGLENITIEDIIDDRVNFQKPIYRIESDKFISLYQGRLYEKYGIYNGKDISLEGMREYFSEGYKEYIENPDNLKKHDPELFRYFERII